jgi:hypothetical protein
MRDAHDVNKQTSPVISGKCRNGYSPPERSGVLKGSLVSSAANRLPS